MSYRGHQQRYKGRGFGNLDIEGQYEKNNTVDAEEKDVDLRRIIFGVSCVIAVSLDPLFFYVPVIEEDKKCIGLDKKLRFISLIMRSVTDIIGVINIILQLNDNGFKEEKFGKAKLLKHRQKKARRYFWLYVLIDIFVILPFPQVIILVIFPELRGSKSLNTRKWLTFFVLFQYVVRFVQSYRSWKDPKRRPNIVSKSPIWVKAAFNFFLYIITSHVLGAFWYFLSIEREIACWHMACENHIGCIRTSFNCDRNLGDYTFLNDFCPIKTPNTTLFDFGVYLGALQSGVVQSKNFSKTFFQCFWWGLRNLSSLGQNLQTSDYVWETCFTVLICLFGLLLFSCFIGNLQLYMQLESSRSEEERKKMDEEKREIDIWIFKCKLPGEMKSQISQKVKERLEKKDVHVENLFHHLPQELGKDVKRYLCLDLLKKMPVLQNMDKELLLKICDSLKPVYYNEHTYIVREGDPIDAMFIIKYGIAWTYTNSNGEAERLENGSYFGEELLELSFSSKLSRLPLSPRTVKTHGRIEAFALMAEDLKNIVSKNWMHMDTENSELFAAYVVQAAWRRHREIK